MKANQLFRKTLPFCIAKLILGMITVLASVILLAISVGIGWLFNEIGIYIGFILWVGGTGVIRFVIMHYFGYLVKAGHIAVLAEATVTGKIPENQVNYGKEVVKKRFAEANVYFAVDKLISGAVKQIQRGIEKVGNALDFIPGMQQVAGLAKFFVELSLGYVDECCLGYTFYKMDEGVFKSSCDGVVIYAQNIKHLLKNAAKTMLKVVIAVIVTVLLVFIPVGLLFKLFNWHGFIAFVLSCFIAWVIKFAFMDSFILCQTMASYMEVAPKTQITFDLYGNLCKISVSFKELFNKSKAETPSKVYEPTKTVTVQSVPNAVGGQSKFCGHCGAKNAVNAGFCGSCGQKI